MQREDYVVGLRNQNDQTEILLRRDEAVTVLGSVPPNSDSSMRYSLCSFDAILDLSGDGQAELLCNVTYNADGVRAVLVYRMKDGISQVADVKDAKMNIPENKHLARLASAAYDDNTGAVTIEYQIEREDGPRVETAPIDYDRLQFEDFTATW